MAEEKKADEKDAKKVRIPSAKKRDKQNLKARLRNRSFKATVKTALTGRTMAINPQTGRIYVAAADAQPDAAGGRPKVLPGTLKLLFFDPAQ